MGFYHFCLSEQKSELNFFHVHLCGLNDVDKIPAPLMSQQVCCVFSQTKKQTRLSGEGSNANERTQQHLT